MEPLRDWLIGRDWALTSATIAAVLASLLVAYLIGWILRLLTQAPRARLLESEDWKQALEQRQVVPRVMRVIVVAAALLLIGPLVEPWPRLLLWTETLFKALLVITVAVAISSALAALFDVLQRHREKEQRLPFKAMAQSAQMPVWVYAAVALLSVMTGKDIWTVLTGLTAVGAVLVYVFRDPILGWTAAVQIVANDLLREGDMISIPKHGADGTVEEIALTSIKVRNFDKTVTAVPTYTVFSEGFRNWRGMFESGIRRMQRAVAIDATSVRFCDPELLRHLELSPLMRELDLLPACSGAGGDPLSDLQPTNIGCFRSWLHAWLERHPMIDRDATLVVRELAPSGRGVPVEFYVFTPEVRWPHYEKLQAEIVDHILAVLPQFDLRPFQEPTGEDLSSLTVATPAAEPGTSTHP